MAPRTRPAESYLPQEWLEWRNFIPLMKKILKTIPTETIPTIMWSDLMRQNPRAKTTPEEANEMIRTLPLIKEDVIFASGDGELLLVFIKGGLYRPWKGKESQLQEVIATALEELQSRYPAPAPKKTDSRHVNHAIEKKKYDAYGVYHFCLWKAQGHSKDNAMLSSDILQSGGRFNASINFFKNITPLTQTMSMLFEALDSDAFQHYRDTYNSWLQRKNCGLSAIHTCGRACFLGLALLRNLRVSPHKDSRDARDGWVGMTVIGDFTGGELVLSAIGCKLQHQPGDVVFFRSAILEHFVAPFQGNRTSFVFFTKDDLFEDREME